MFTSSIDIDFCTYHCGKCEFHRTIAPKWNERIPSDKMDQCVERSFPFDTTEQFRSVEMCSALIHWVRYFIFRFSHSPEQQFCECKERLKNKTKRKKNQSSFEFNLAWKQAIRIVYVITKRLFNEIHSQHVKFIIIFSFILQMESHRSENFMQWSVYGVVFWIPNRISPFSNWLRNK